MAKQLFQTKASAIKKKKSFMISSEINARLGEIELRAEKAGVSFPLNEHVEEAILRLVKTAEFQLSDIEGEVLSGEHDDNSVTTDTLQDDDASFESSEFNN